MEIAKDTVKEFRNVLMALTHPHGSKITGYEITKPAEELHKILFNLKLFNYEKTVSDELRQCVKSYYKKLVRKSRDIISEELLDETKTEDKSKNSGKNKKGGRGKKNKRNKNRKQNAHRSKGTSSINKQDAGEAEEDNESQDNIFSTNYSESVRLSLVDLGEEVLIDEIDFAYKKKKANNDSLNPATENTENIDQEKDEEVGENKIHEEEKPISMSSKKNYEKSKGKKAHNKASDNDSKDSSKDKQKKESKKDKNKKANTEKPSIPNKDKKPELPKREPNQTTKAGYNKGPETVEEFNKEQEELNSKLFDKVEDITPNNSEENTDSIINKNEEPENDQLKVEDFEEDKEPLIQPEEPTSSKFDDFNNSEDFVQETRSEESKEDQHKLDKISSRKDKKYIEEKKDKRNSEKPAKNTRSKNTSRQNKKNKKKEDKHTKLEELKQGNYKSKGFRSEPEDNVPSPNYNKADMNQVYDAENDSVDGTFAKTSNKHLSYTCEAKSAKSDQSKNKTKSANSTNPTIETSSVKDSSVASNQDIKTINTTNKQKKEKSDINSGSWAQSERKPRKSKHPKKKKPLKSDRPKYINTETDDEPQKASNKSNSPSNSIWDQDMVEAIFSPKRQKKQKKGKKKGGSTKGNSGLVEQDTTPKAKTHRGNDRRKNKLTKDSELEEKKVSASSKPNFHKNKGFNQPKSPSKPPLEPKETKKASADTLPDPPSTFQKEHKVKSFSHKNPYKILEEPKPQENAKNTGNYYQGDPGYEPKPFSKNHSQNYYNSYKRDLTGYIDQEPYGWDGNLDADQGYDYHRGYNNSYYDEGYGMPDYYNQGKMDKSHSMPNQPQPNIDTKQFECERFLYETLSREIEKEADDITQQVNMIKDYRYDIKYHIEQLAIETFTPAHTNVQAHIYGSVATGLALPESDMDIVVTGVNSFGSKDNHGANIGLLYEGILAKFNGKIICKAQKIIHTQVPIIKLSFSLSEYYDLRSKQEPGVLPFLNFDAMDAINPNLKELAVDISICDSFENIEHQGIKAAYFVETNLAQYPVLRPVCLMLKKLLVKHELNNPYTGGLGSFSLFLMLYAAYFIEKMNTYETFHSESVHTARLFAWFLAYFGEYFDISSMAIMFMQESLPLAIPKAY